MSSCEIVENVACGQSFQYCRTHKVEPKDCPGNKRPEGIESLAALQYEINKIAATVAAHNPKREFKVGDKVRRRGGGRVKVVVQGDANVVGMTREKFESLYGVAVLCDDGFFHCQREMEHV